MEIEVDGTRPIQLIKSDIKRQLFGGSACVRTCMSGIRGMSTLQELVDYFSEKGITITTVNE